MEEKINEKTTTTEEPINTETDINTGSQSETISQLDRYDAIAKRTEEAAARIEAANKIAADLELRRAMGGQTKAGQVEEKPREKTAKEYAEAVMSGEIKNDN